MPTSSLLAQSSPSDRDLSIQAKQSLRETRCAALQRIRYRVVDGIVELSGDVPSFYFKQIAQEVLLTLSHVQGIENRLHVRCSA
jgi:osmotically-inducible protein OsmY